MFPKRPESAVGAGMAARVRCILRFLQCSTFVSTVYGVLAFGDARAQTSGVWTQPPTYGSLFQMPYDLYGHVTIYDPLRRRMLVYGGAYETRQWLYSLDLIVGGVWHSFRVAGAPVSGATDACGIYDPVRDRMLVFGGNGASAINTVTALSLGVLATVGTPPSPRWASACVYDDVRDRMIVLGGYDPSSGFLADVWAMSLSGTPGWSPITPVGTGPSPRDGAAAVYDQAGDRIVLYGGNVNGAPDGGVWELSLSGAPAWRQLQPVGSAPPPRFFHSAVLDSATHSMIIAGGYNGVALSDVWRLSLDGEGAWTQLQGVSGPMPARYEAGAVFDPVARRLVISGGRNEIGATFDDVPVLMVDRSPPFWYLLGHIANPRPRFATTTVFDPVGDRVILFGGNKEPYGLDQDAEYWELDLDSYWRSVTPTGGGPGNRFGHGAIIDAARSRMIIAFGYYPYGLGAFLVDVWALSLAGTPQWITVVTTGGPPPPRDYFCAAYDSRRDRMLIFGGNSNGTYKNDVWSLSFGTTNTWQLLSAAGTPPSPRIGVSAVYDAVRDRLLIYGGFGPSSSTVPLGDDLWELSLGATPTWHVLPASPFPRAFATMISDPVRDRVVVYGGEAAMPYGDAWEYSLSGLPQWRQLSPDALTYPPGRFAHAATYDSKRDRMVMFGGVDSYGTTLGDPWFLTWTDLATPILATAVDWSATPEAVHVEWYSTVASAVDVIRREFDAPWESQGRFAFDGHGFLSFVDQAVRPGTEYEYALRLPNGTATGSARILVPSRVAESLRGFLPNPASLRPVIDFSVPDHAPAWLELMDIGGRLIWRREVGSLGAGTHGLLVDTERGLAPGVYWIRLSRAGHSLVARGAVLR